VWLISPVGCWKQQRYAQDERNAMMTSLPRDVMAN
jgi:hypothetical protein